MGRGLPPISGCDGSRDAREAAVAPPHAAAAAPPNPTARRRAARPTCTWQEAGARRVPPGQMAQRPQRVAPGPGPQPPAPPAAARPRTAPIFIVPFFGTQHTRPASTHHCALRGHASTPSPTMKHHWELNLKLRRFTLHNDLNFKLQLTPCCHRRPPHLVCAPPVYRLRVRAAP